MRKFVKVVVAVPAILLIVMGLRWLVDPAGIAPEFGFDLAGGLGRSSQVGDMSSFFLTAGICVLLGLATDRRIWFYPAVMLLLLASVGRLLSWLLHDAAFAGPMILFEVVVAAIWLSAARWIPKQGGMNG